MMPCTCMPPKMAMDTAPTYCRIKIIVALTMDGPPQPMLEHGKHSREKE